MEIRFTKESYDKIQALVTNCPTEIMGLGKIEKTGDSVRIIDIIILPQEASAAHAEFDKEKLTDFLVERAQIGDSADWKLWWHSHAEMGCFWSTTDTGNIERMGETADWIASVVFNHKMEYKARIDVYNPFSMTSGDISIVREVQPNTEAIEWAIKEIEEKVAKPKPTTFDYSKKWNRQWLDDKGEEKEDDDKDDSVLKMAMEIQDKMDQYEGLTKKEKSFVQAHKDCFVASDVCEYYRIMKAMKEGGYYD